MPKNEPNRENEEKIAPFTQMYFCIPNMDPSLSSDIKSPAQSGLPLSSTEPHCWRFINASVNLPFSFSQLQFICSPFTYVVIIVCVPSLCLPFPFVSLSLYLFSHLFSLFTLHLFLYLPTPHRQRLCEWLSEKITLLWQTNSSFLFSRVLFREGDGKVAPVKSACSWPWRMHLH